MDQRLLERAAGEGRIRGIALEAWEVAREAPHQAGGALSRVMREARALHSRERRLVSDLLYDLIRHRAVLAAVLKTDEGRALWTGWLVVLGLPVQRAAAEVPGVDPARWATLRGGLEAAREAATEGLSPVEALAVQAGIGVEGAQGLRQAFGEEALAFVDGSNERAPVTLRAAGDREALAARLADEGVQTEPCPLAPRGLKVVGRVNLQALRSFREGAFEVQDEGSQLLAELVQPEGTVLDLCAGAGGKTLALARPGVRLVATDVRQRALDNLRKRARRAGVRVEVHRLDGGSLPPQVAAIRADRVLVDAPCSGTGTWRRHPALRWRLQPERLEELEGLQRQLLEQGASLVRPGGRLIYGTCSVLPSENEAQVEAFLQTHPDFTVVEARRILSVADRYLRLAPHTHGTDGFFGAVMQRG